MKNVEIITSQNVVLQYELASLQDRVLAFVLDMICIALGFTLLSGILSTIFAPATQGQGIAVLLVMSLFCFYSLAFEFFNKGRSLGKMALKIQVIKLAGGKATFSDYAARWAFRLIDIYFSFGGIASILVVSSVKGQRIGDIIANTAVIKTQAKTKIDLNDLLSIHETSKYVPVYQQARKLHEQDALLIKTALERYRRFHNESHAEAIDLLCDKMEEMLGIPKVDEAKQAQFLQTILKDYVVLSR